MSGNMGFKPLGEGVSFSGKEVSNNGALGMKTECRICREEDFVRNMESPCSCNGRLKLSHRKCIQKWCNEKKDATCEICRKPFDGYTVANQEEMVNSNEDSGSRNVTRVLTVEDAEQSMYADPFDDFGFLGEWRIPIIRSLVLVSGVIMLLYVYDQAEVGDDSLGNIVSAFASEHIFCLRLMAYMVPIYILCWIIHFVICWSERRVGQPYRPYFTMYMKQRQD